MSDSRSGDSSHSGDAEPASELESSSTAPAAEVAEGHRPTNPDQAATRATESAPAVARNKSPTLQRELRSAWIGAIEVTTFS